MNLRMSLGMSLRMSLRMSLSMPMKSLPAAHLQVETLRSPLPSFYSSGFKTIEGTRYCLQLLLMFPPRQRSKERSEIRDKKGLMHHVFA